MDGIRICDSQKKKFILIKINAFHQTFESFLTLNLFRNNILTCRILARFRDVY
jgi:hypothetical protein